MSKTVTIRLDEESYAKIKAAAQADNRPISNFLETAALRLIDEVDCADKKRRPLRSFSFAGIWKDRKDMADSLKYVDRLRRQPRR